MFPILAIAFGIAVLVFGKRLAVLGAAVGALCGIVFLRLIPGTSDNLLLALAIPIILAVIGFFVAGFAKGIVNIVLMVLGALAGAAIMQGFLNLFPEISVFLDLLLVVLGGVIGLVLVMRFKDWAMIILAGLVGGLLVTRGLSDWLTILEGAMGTFLVIALAGVSIAFQGGFFGGKREGID